MGGTDLLAIAICAEKSPHPFSPLWGICHQLSKYCQGQDDPQTPASRRNAHQ
ncbi:MAG: hypothetical protein HWQ43_26660 [Nostoc sp. JL31]|uniref:hypothetical protein n=1 Tax=Nostoc sp. JL31 TaxID=2815395 RepID=UPI0025FCB154|nr:hypothetical protein [Nostoc sp. JL31]MBN3892567.1 hypothetical protein [Nostoc sp. JL31]